MSKMTLKAWILLLQVSLTLTSPIFAPQFLSGGTGRNIRHLPCVSLRSGETGVCMFAFTCVKSNGTHLGTCIDRFYFGSCCKLAETDDSDIYPADNAIDGASASGGSFVTTDSAFESNDIPDYLTRPKPIGIKKPESSTSTTSGHQTALLTTRQPTTTTRQPTTTTRQPTTTTTQPTTTTRQPTTTTTRPTTKTTTESQRIVTKRPSFFSTPYTTTQPSIAFSTLQTLHDYSHGSATSSTTHNNPRVTTSRPVTLKNSTSTLIATSTSVGSSARPPATTNPTHRPSTNPVVTKKPWSSAITRPTNTRKPVTSTTAGLVGSSVSTTLSTTERTSTRFPPRNATTTRPLSTITTRKPAPNPTRRPTIVTNRPATGTRRPTTASKPLVTTTRPILSSDKVSSTSSKPTQTYRPTPITSTQETPTTTSDTDDPRPSHRPGTKRPSTTSSDEKIVQTRPTTLTPVTTTSRPSSKPTKVTLATSAKPIPVKTTARPEFSTETTKPTTSFPSTFNVSSVARPVISRPTSPAPTRPKPSEKPLKPLKPLKPFKPTKPSTTTVSTTSPTTTVSTHASVMSVTVPLLNATTIANEILPTKIATTIVPTDTTTPTKSPPGLVTWSSNSDDDVTRPTEISSTTTGSTPEASTEPEWSPITTPDGWIMIQSPTTEKTPINLDDSTTKPEMTKVPTTSGKPSSESVPIKTTTSTTTTTPTTTTTTTITRPTLPTILSTIATVTTAPDLPVPMETLNMSDYKQVCGRRLFPESRIVGGDHSAFGRWPWQISLRQWRQSAYLHKCGAALLNENWAITAAHCVENVPPSDLLLRIGEHDLANEDEPYGFQERRVQIVASHPQFDPRTFEYDLALLRFYEPLQPFQPNLLPICLPDDDENYVGQTAYVTGWGRLYEDGPLPSVLQEVSVPVVNNAVCEGMYRNAGYIEHIPNIFICAGWRKGGFDSCEGDSGGPMVIQRQRDKRWILAGVISWGIGCAEPNQPGVYTRISEFREWINQILQF